MDKNRDERGRFAENNKIRLKWTKPKTKKKLAEMLKILADDDNRYFVDENGKRHKHRTEINIMPALCVKAGVNTFWLKDIRRKFESDDDIQDLIKEISNILEQRVWLLTANNEINPYLGLFTLKAYHNKIEKQHVKTESEITQEIKGEVSVNLIYPKDKDEK